MTQEQRQGVLHEAASKLVVAGYAVVEMRGELVVRPNVSKVLSKSGLVANVRLFDAPDGPRAEVNVGRLVRHERRFGQRTPVPEALVGLVRLSLA